MLICVRGSEANRTTNPLHTSRWPDRALHASYHGADVYDCDPTSPQAIVRNILVYSPPRVLFYDWPIHPCNGMLREGQRQPRLHTHLPILLYRTLSGVHELEVHHLGRYRILCGESLS
jgi:hypothetical protein